MKRSRVLYFHPETNSGKIKALEALHIEYRRYLQSCVDLMIQSKRMRVPRGEILRFFPVEKTLSTNLVMACQQHAVEIISSWVTTLYTRRIKSHIRVLFKDDKINEATRFQLFTIGKYSVDRPTDSIPQEAIDLYWSVLLDPKVSGKSPTASNRIGMRMSIHTSDIKVNETELSTWWLGFSNLKKSHRAWVPIVANPHIKSPEEVVDGCLIRKDRRGRWRVEVLEKKIIEEPKLDPKMPRIGVDVGLNAISATSRGDLYGISVKSKFDSLYAKIRTLRANRQRQGLKENSPRLDKLEDQLSGLVKTATGTVANKLIKKYPGHAFVIEDLNLSGCRGQKRFAYRALHHSLSTKVPTIVVNPAYSSQMCPSCGYVSRSNRSGIKFKCRGCGRISHADVVGGINLLGRSEDKQIGLDDHQSEVKALLRERYRLRRDSSSGGLTDALVAPSRKLTTKVSPNRKIGIASNSEEFP